MRIFKYFVLAFFLVALCEAANTTADFDRLKSLEGTWVTKTENGKMSEISYKLTSGGSVVMETLKEPNGGDMITMYHLNNGKIMMTHYCMLNNQPRMESQPSSNPNQIVFNFVDGTNMADANAMHMHKLVITFKDKDHFSEEWTLSDKGQEKPTTFEFERAR